MKCLNLLILCLVLTLPILTGAYKYGEIVGPDRASKVGFPHREHQKMMGGCIDCHGKGEPGPIKQFGQDWAHTNCVKCHNEYQVGPVTCSDCHKY